VQRRPPPRLKNVHDANVLTKSNYCGTAGAIARRASKMHSPALLAAADQPLFSEELPYRVSDIAKRSIWHFFRAIAGFAALIGVPVAIFSGFADGVFIFGVLFLVGTPVILLFSLAASAALPLMRIKMIVWRGKFIVRTGTHMLVADLTDCSWREGRLSDLTIWNLDFLLRGPSLIVVLPKSISPDGNCVAVGCTLATLEIWRSFFTIARVPVVQDTLTPKSVSKVNRKSAT
jgi:hypothetical protein